MMHVFCIALPVAVVALLVSLWGLWLNYELRPRSKPVTKDDAL